MALVVLAISRSRSAQRALVCIESNRRNTRNSRARKKPKGQLIQLNWSWGLLYVKSAIPWVVERYISTRLERSCTWRMLGLGGRALATPDSMFLKKVG